MRLRIGLYAALVLLAGASAVTAIVFNSVWPPSWRIFRARHAALVARLATDPGARPPLSGPALPGNAWPAYLDAQRAFAAGLPADWPDIIRYRRETWFLDRSRLDLQPFREAARRAHAAFPVDWSRDIDQVPPDTTILRTVVQPCLAASAEFRLGSRDIPGAIEDAATLLQIGADFSRVPLNFGPPGRGEPFLSGEHAALPFFEEGLRVMRDVVDSAAASPADLREAEALLARLETQVADIGAAAEAELALAGLSLIATPSDFAAGSKGQVPHEARLGNIRSLVGRFYLDQETRITRLRRYHDEPWSEPRALEPWPFDVECPWIEWPGLTSPVLEWRDRLHREIRAAAAVCRAAARHRLGLDTAGVISPYTRRPVDVSHDDVYFTIRSLEGIRRPDRISPHLFDRVLARR